MKMTAAMERELRTRAALADELVVALRQARETLIRMPTPGNWVTVVEDTVKFIDARVKKYEGR